MPSSPPIRLSLSVVCAALVILLWGCQKQGGEASAATASAQTSAGIAPSGACRLLQPAELQAIFAGAKNGEVDDSRKQYGISACTWSTPRGSVVAQFWESDGSSAKAEASGIVLGVLDPLKGESVRNNVRYEAIHDVGEQAVAVVETADAARGVISDCALLVAQRGKHILVIIAPGLARAERTKALESLQALGKSAVSRL